jgi:hypothetical protein
MTSSPQYGDCWSVDIAIRDTNAFDGLGREQCQKRQRIVGVHTCRLVIAAARPLWCITYVECGTTGSLCDSRPWYRPQVVPRQRDGAEACREALHKAGSGPLPRGTRALAENHAERA